MANLSFDELRLFARVAALGTLSAVARERNVPVSQISRGLQRIEATYSTQLILRTTHGLSLTPEGEILQAYAQRWPLSAASWKTIPARSAPCAAWS